MHSGGQATSGPTTHTPPTHNSDDPLNIRELESLSALGEKVVMPAEVHSGTPKVPSFFDSKPCTASIQSTLRATHTPMPNGLAQNLDDLLDLVDSGEQVLWPSGFDALKTNDFVADFKRAIQAGQLYKRD